MLLTMIIDEKHSLFTSKILHVAALKRAKPRPSHFVRRLARDRLGVYVRKTVCAGAFVMCCQQKEHDNWRGVGCALCSVVIRTFSVVFVQAVSFWC